MVGAEACFTQSVAALATDLGLCVAFWIVGPAAWRWLSAGHGSRAVIGLFGYLALCTTVVGLLGFLFPAALGLGWTYVTAPPSLGVVLVLFMVGGWGLGRDIELEEGLLREGQRAAALAEEAERARLLALRAHLDPHFLFNTLNAIAEWCREDPVAAEAATLKLATMLRAVLSSVRVRSWPLRRELDLLRLYFEVYAARDPEKYETCVELPEPLPAITVPPMILLPLAENAIKHGPSAGHLGQVRLLVTPPKDGVVRLQLLNPGAFEARREGGEGLAMVEKRLELAYDGHARLAITSQGDETSIVVDLPTEGPRDAP
jgi:hypothetical protein